MRRKSHLKLWRRRNFLLVIPRDKWFLRQLKFNRQVLINMILKHRENHLRHFWPTSLVRTYFQTYGRWVPLLKRLLKTNQFLSKMQINFRFFFRFDFQAQRLSFLAITMLIKCFGSHRPTHYIHSNSTKSCSCENKQDDLGRILPCLFYRFLHFFFFWLQFNPRRYPRKSELHILSLVMFL